MRYWPDHVLRVLGIDPGLEGGCALLHVDLEFTTLVDAIDIPTRGEDAKRRVDVLELASWISNMEPDVAFIERAGVMPKQGIASGFKYGRAVGALEAAVILAKIRLEVVEPAVWKRAFGLKGGDKEQARQALLRVLPSAERLVSRKRDHGRAEAALIAMWGADAEHQRKPGKASAA